MENLILDDSVAELPKQHPSLYTIANSGRRFWNLIIDQVITYIIIIIVCAIYIYMTKQIDISTLASYAIAILVDISYFTIMETYLGKTIGKMITGTRVLNKDFGQPTLSTIFKRSWCRLIPFEALSFLGSTGWHDSISRTVVVLD